MADSPAAERSLHADDVRDLVREHLPDLAARPLRLAAQGWDNATWRLGDDLAVRLPRRAVAAPLIRHEQFALPILGPRLAALGVRTPVPLHHGRPTRSFPWAWSVVPWIDGEPALGVDRSENRSWAGEIGRALVALHHTAPPDAPLNPVRGVPLAHRDASVRARLGNSRLGDAELRSRLRDIWDAGLAAPTNTEHVWIHGDVHPGNILLSEERLHALIDFGDVTGGDPAYDLAIAWLAFDAPGRRAFHAATSGRYDDATRDRARAWAAAVALIFLDQSDDRPEFRALGAATAQELTSTEV
ncbi:MAG: aminoglycoside phosphotransferase family protein [Actinomycetota bacterium]